MAAYLSANEVVSAPGRLQAFWQNMDSGMHDVLIREASAKVDEILGVPDEGILQQLGKTTTVYVTGTRDTLFLPNKPITNIQSITVLPNAGLLYTLPVVMVSTPTAPATVRLWGGQCVKYSGDPAGSVIIQSWGRTQMPFQDGDTITVVYDCGYSASQLPSAVKRATRLILASMLFSEADNPSGAFRISEDGVSIMYGGRSAEINPVEDEAAEILQPYRLEVYSN